RIQADRRRPQGADERSRDRDRCVAAYYRHCRQYQRAASILMDSHKPPLPGRCIMQEKYKVNLDYNTLERYAQCDKGLTALAWQKFKAMTLSIADKLSSSVAP